MQCPPSSYQNYTSGGTKTEEPYTPWRIKIVRACLPTILRNESKTVNNSSMRSSSPTLNPTNQSIDLQIKASANKYRDRWQKKNKAKKNCSYRMKMTNIQIYIIMWFEMHHWICFPHTPTKTRARTRTWLQQRNTGHVPWLLSFRKP